MTSEPIRIFIASAPDGIDSEADLICEHSIRSRTQHPLDIRFMRLTRDETSPWYSNPEKGEGWMTDNWVTCFSGFRWAIPHVCGYSGKAIYTDNDIVYLDDIANLWNIPMLPGKAVVAKSMRRYCVMLIDCAELKKYVPAFDDLRRARNRVMLKAHQQAVQFFRPDQNWNCLDGDNWLPIYAMRAIHFTSINTQPWVPMAIERLALEGRKHWFDDKPKIHPRADLHTLAMREYANAIEDGYREKDYYPETRFGDIPKRSLAGYKGIHK